MPGPSRPISPGRARGVGVIQPYRTLNHIGRTQPYKIGKYGAAQCNNIESPSHLALEPLMKTATGYADNFRPLDARVVGGADELMALCLDFIGALLDIAWGARPKYRP